MAFKMSLSDPLNVALTGVTRKTTQEKLAGVVSKTGGHPEDDGKWVQFVNPTRKKIGLVFLVAAEILLAVFGVARLARGDSDLAKGLGVKCAACHPSNFGPAQEFVKATRNTKNPEVRKQALEDLVKKLGINAVVDEDKIWAAVESWPMGE